MIISQFSDWFLSIPAVVIFTDATFLNLSEKTNLNLKIPHSLNYLSFPLDHPPFIPSLLCFGFLKCLLNLYCGHIFMNEGVTASGDLLCLFKSLWEGWVLPAPQPHPLSITSAAVCLKYHPIFSPSHRN